jgi:hypothetical protein
MKFLGMQIIVEGLALAAFGTIRDTATNPLLRDLTAAVMEDESRHVAFGVLSLREYCADLTEPERREREDFVYEACVLMRDRITNREVWEAMGMDADACVAASDHSELATQFRYRLFSKIVPNVPALLEDRAQREEPRPALGSPARALPEARDPPVREQHDLGRRSGDRGRAPDARRGNRRVAAPGTSSDTFVPASLPVPRRPAEHGRGTLRAPRAQLFLS